MNAQTVNQAGQAVVATMTFAVAELGAMKATVDSLAYSRNKTEQTKSAKLVVSFLSQMARVRGGKALNNVKLVGYSTDYNLEDDELEYTFVLQEIPAASPKATA